MLQCLATAFGIHALLLQLGLLRARWLDTDCTRILREDFAGVTGIQPLQPLGAGADLCRELLVFIYRETPDPGRWEYGGYLIYEWNCNRWQRQTWIWPRRLWGCPDSWRTCFNKNTQAQDAREARNAQKDWGDQEERDARVVREREAQEAQRVWGAALDARKALNAQRAAQYARDTREWQFKPITPCAALPDHKVMHVGRDAVIPQVEAPWNMEEI